MQKLLIVLLILTCLTSSYAASRCKQHKSKKRNIISPPRVQKTKKNLSPDTNMTFDCQEGMCNGTSRYPLHYLRKLLRNNNYGLLNFGGSALKPFEPPPIGVRWLDEAEKKEINMCGTKEYYMVPRVARNVDYEWKFVVQIGKITQSVQYDKCKENSYCFARDYMPDNYATVCKQHKVVIKLLTVHPNGTVSPDHFPIPGGCACAYAKLKYL